MDRVVREMKRFDTECKHIVEQLDQGRKQAFFTEELIQRLEAKVTSITSIENSSNLQKFLQELHVHVSQKSLRKLLVEIAAGGLEVSQVTYGEFFREVLDGARGFNQDHTELHLLKMLRGTTSLFVVEAEGPFERCEEATDKAFEFLVTPTGGALVTEDTE